MSTELTREELARRTAARLSRGAGVTDADYQALRSHMIGFLGQKTNIRDAAKAADIVDASVERFLAAARESGRIRPATALAYLRRIVRNNAIDRIRRDRASPADYVDATVLEPVDAIAKFVDERATAQKIQHLMAEAAKAGDLIGVKVMNEYLKLAESLGESPSTRTVALHARVSHTTVRNALARLRQSLEHE